jgi:hypothetical protein
MIERVMLVVAVVTVVGLLWACTHPDVRAGLPSFMSGLLVPRWPADRAWDPADATRLLTAITFAGLGGFWTLFYSSWLREKGVGMASHMGRLTSPVTGRGEFVEDSGFAPARAPALAARLRAWTRFLWADAGVGVFGNLLTTLASCLLAWVLLFPQQKIPTAHELVTFQADYFALSWGVMGHAMFLLVAAAFLADTWLATVDAVAHTHTEMTRIFFPRVAARWTYRTTYYAWLVALTAITSVTMAQESPATLILTSAVIGFVGTVLYSAALVVLNYRLLPRLVPVEAAPPRAGGVMLTLVAACYAVLAVLYAFALLV